MTINKTSHLLVCQSSKSTDLKRSPSYFTQHIAVIVTALTNIRINTFIVGYSVKKLYTAGKKLFYTYTGKQHSQSFLDLLLDRVHNGYFTIYQSSRFGVRCFSSTGSALPRISSVLPYLKLYIYHPNAISCITKISSSRATRDCHTIFYLYHAY